MAGWTILDRLKHDPATRHIPVHVISGDENRRRGLALGAMTLPREDRSPRNRWRRRSPPSSIRSEQRIKKLLLVTGDEIRREQLADDRSAGDDVEIIDVPPAAARRWPSSAQQYLDGIVVDLACWPICRPSN